MSEMMPDNLRECLWKSGRCRFCGGLRHSLTCRGMAFVSVWEADRAHIEALDLRHITDMAYISAADETIVELRTRIEALERVDQDALLPDGWENNSPLWVAGWNAALRAVAAAIRRAALAAKDK